MKVLVFGPSGAGKTYLFNALHKSGINAYDSDGINGLSAWYDQQGNKVSAPATAGEGLRNHYSFLWDKWFLQKFLNGFTDVYIFGGSGNLFGMLDLFDKIFFLKVEPGLQKDRILNGSRAAPLMDFDEGSMVIWGDWLEQEAQKRSIPFIDASLSPEEIFEIITTS